LSTPLTTSSSKKKKKQEISSGRDEALLSQVGKWVFSSPGAFSFSCLHLYFRIIIPPPLSPLSTILIYRDVVVEVLRRVKTSGIQLLYARLQRCDPFLKSEEVFKEASLQGNGSPVERLETGTLVTVAGKTSLKGSDAEIRVTLARMEAKKLLVFSIPLNLNRVSVEDLCLVPGIGEPWPEIVTYRVRKKASAPSRN